MQHPSPPGSPWSWPTRRPKRGDPTLAQRLDAPEAALESAWKALSEERPTLRHAERFLDHRTIVDRAIDEVHRGLGSAFEAHLPRLVEGGAPRLQVLAFRIVRTGLARVDLESLHEALEQTQAGEPLSTAELWALPLALRIELVDELAAALARLVRDGEVDPESDRIAENCVRSLRLLENLEWPKVFERHSRLEEALRGDPIGVYAQMDFATRDAYRRQVERLAWSTGRSEVEVARVAIERAGPAGHVGHALVGADRREFERALGHRAPVSVRARRWLRSHPALVYLGPIAALTVTLEGALGAALYASPTALLAMGVALVPAVGLAVAVVNQAVVLALPPSLLPKLDLSKGLRPQDRTLVVMPSLLTDVDEVDELVARLEVHRLGHPDPRLLFALVTDHTDAPSEVMPEDVALVARATAGIEALNARYPDAPFLLLHRKRDFNAAEACWMGWERKRGKLAELDAVLLGRPRAGAWTFVGEPARLRGIRYVVTLDADTSVPRGGVHRLVGTLAHPLNRPRFDPETGRVVAGYTVLQPRVEASPTSESVSAFARIFSGARGLDPYANAVSDVYQDLFGEGVYVGKGIYDVHAFERALEGKIPENALLSHDLLEGLHGRAGLVSDVVVLEEHPRTWMAWARRQHRWIRGDWQLLPWLRAPRGLPLIARWKLVDNLRRSLDAPALLAFLLAGWTVLPGSAVAWTALVAAVPLASAAPALVIEAARRARPGMEPPPSVPQVGRKVTDTVLRVGVGLTLLPHEAAVSLDAITRTLVRLYVTRRHLLEWTTAAATDRLVAENGPARAVAQMAAAPALAVVTALVLAAVARDALPVATPFLLAWLLSPALALWLSRPSSRGVPPPDPGEVVSLRRLARRTSLFFETLAGPEHHWLAPDHLQVEPGPQVATRTSPTNVGFGLLATLAAFDLGYAGPGRTWLRLRNTVESVKRAERYRGHLYNWVDTRTLGPLEPRYVSTVDSGNLAAALAVVRQALPELAAAPVLGAARWEGLADTAGVLEELLAEVDPGGPAWRATRAIRHRAGLAPQRLPDALRLAASLEEACADLDRELWLLVDARTELSPGRIDELRGWAAAVREHLSLVRSEATWLAPWLDIPLPPGLAPVPVDQLLEVLGAPLVVEGVPERCATALARIGAIEAGLEPGPSPWRRWCDALREALDRAGRTADEVSAGLRDLAATCDRLVDEMDFRFLYDEERELLRIGYNASTGRFDPGHYDLLASESRLTSLHAIARGQLPVTHWLRLGRQLRRPGRVATLTSWSGSMFEYLMTPLLLREGDDTLLGQSARAAVAEQVAWGRRHGLPWGVSESCYHAADDQGTWLYRAFGVPSLGLRRGLEDDLVVAPYATLLAARFAPREVGANLRALGAVGALGRYGLYESIDFTPDRLPPGRSHAPIRTFLAHHQGMVLLAVVNRIREDLFVRRFHSDRAVRTAEMLLLESSPRRVPVERTRPPTTPGRRPPGLVEPWERPDGRVPERMALSNGRLTVVAGAGGWMTWRGVRLTRRGVGFEPWIADGGRRRWPTSTRRVFHPHLVERHVDWGDLSIEEQVAVAPDLDAEIRTVRLTNEGHLHRRVTLGGYAEVVLGDEADDARDGRGALVCCAYDVDLHALLFQRPGSAGPGPWLLHMLVTRGEATRDGFETDRDAFLGRHGRRRDLHDLGGGLGPTADPVAVLASAFELPPGSVAEAAFVTLVGDDRDELLRQAANCRSFPWMGAALDLARDQAVEELGAVGCLGSELPTAQALLSRVLHPWHGARAPAEHLRRDVLGPSALRPLGVSVDLPLVVVSVAGHEDGPVAGEVVRAWDLWRRRGVPFELALIEEGAVRGGRRHPEGVHTLLRDRLSLADRDALLAAAHVLVDGSAGPLLDQLTAREQLNPRLAPLVGLRRPPDPEPLGFGPGPGEDVLRLEPGGPPTPAPCRNVVVGTGGFGFVVSESGAGCTFSGRAGERRLTRWANDPVLDPPSETLYLRDEETAAIWSATPRPAPGPGSYEVRHEAGRTTFLHRSHGLEVELTLTVDADEPVKVLGLRLTDRTHRPRRVTATLLVEWLLGRVPERQAPHLVVEVDADREVFLARNPWCPTSPQAVAFVAATRRLHGLTADRVEVLGVPERRDRPPGLVRIGLSSTVEPAREPCAALQVHVELVPGGTEETHFLLGEAPDRAAALRLADRLRDRVGGPVDLAVPGR